MNLVATKEAKFHRLRIGAPGKRLGDFLSAPRWNRPSLHVRQQGERVHG
jgi:hypothetical protein